MDKKYNSGNYNSGSRNSGDYNSGSCNSGSYNSGSYNSERRNSGSYNSGGRNSGDYNSGGYNSGSCNSGNYNSGSYNSGGRNSGDYNSGGYNSGSRNSGDYNSGGYNSGSHNSGWFNTNEPKARFFNKESNITLTEFYNSGKTPDCNIPVCRWINKNDMTEKEKESVIGWDTMGGYLKTLSYKEAWSVFWNETDEANKKRFLNLPNFDADIFFEITGIDVRARSEKMVIVDGKKFSESTIKEALRQYINK